MEEYVWMWEGILEQRGVTAPEYGPYKRQSCIAAESCLPASLLHTQVVSHNMDTETKHLSNNHLPSKLKPKAQSSETGGGCHGNNTHTDHCDGPLEPEYIIIKEAGLEQFKNTLCVYPSNCGSWCYYNQ